MILFGTCAWADHEPFYPSGLAPAERLAHYSRYFSLVEVDATYYALLSAASFARWARKTPPGFVFNVKAYRTLTGHQQASPDALAADEHAFERSLEPLAEAGKLGSVLFQFPPWFVRSSAAEKRLFEIRDRFAAFDLAVEFRHRSWFSNEAAQRHILSLLTHLRLIHTVADEPQVGEDSVPLVEAATHPELALVRLHGRNKQTWHIRGTSKDRFNYLYSDGELDELLSLAKRLEGTGRTVQVLTNNNHANYAVKNALTLQALASKTPAPDITLFDP